MTMLRYAALVVALTGCLDTTEPEDTDRWVLPEHDGWSLYSASHADDIRADGSYPLMLCTWGYGTTLHTVPPLSWSMTWDVLTVECPDEAENLFVAWLR